MSAITDIKKALMQVEVTLFEAEYVRMNSAIKANPRKKDAIVSAWRDYKKQATIRMCKTFSDAGIADVMPDRYVDAFEQEGYDLEVTNNLFDGKDLDSEKMSRVSSYGRSFLKFLRAYEEDYVKSDKRGLPEAFDFKTQEEQEAEIAEYYANNKEKVERVLGTSL